MNFYFFNKKFNMSSTKGIIAGTADIKLQDNL